MKVSILNLVILGFLFAMRSGKYVKATKGERKTHLLRLQNIDF